MSKIAFRLNGLFIFAVFTIFVCMFAVYPQFMTRQSNPPSSLKNVSFTGTNNYSGNSTALNSVRESNNQQISLFKQTLQETSDYNLFLTSGFPNLAPPPNDNFSDAQSISGLSGSFSGTTIDATRETGEPNHGNFSEAVGVRSVWYKWTAPRGGAIRFSVVGSGSSICLDSRARAIAIYTGSSVTNLTEVAKAAASCELTATVQFQATEGQEYKIAVDGFIFSLNDGTYRGLNFSLSIFSIGVTTYSVIGTLNNLPNPAGAIVKFTSSSFPGEVDCLIAGSNYTCTGLALGGNYTITPSHPAVTFDPPSRTYSNISRNYSGENFTAVLPDSLSVSSSSVTEGNSGTSSLNFTVNRSVGSSPISTSVTVNYSTSNGTATAGQDYTAVPNGTLIIPAGQTSGTISVQVIGDTLFEPNETFTLTLSNPQGAAIATGQGAVTGTIINDDFGGQLKFSIESYTVSESDGNAAITVTRTNGAASNVTVNYAASNGTATAGQDYNASSGTLAFGANETSKTFNIPILNDSISEPNETVNLTISGTTGGGTLGAPQTAVLTIIDNDNSRRTGFDFDGDGKSDIGVFRPSIGSWYLLGSSSGFSGIGFGVNSDLIAPADYNGDGKADIAVFRPENGAWYYLNSSNNQFVGVSFGQNGDIPLPADFDGDGRADINVFRPLTGSWYRLNSSNGQFIGIGFGQNGDVPLIADFDGDGKSDIAVFRPSTRAFYWLNSSNGQFNGVQFGLETDKPVPADFDGDGRSDIAVFRPSNGTWYILGSQTGFFGQQFGQNGDKPAAADYDGDGRADIAVFRPANGAWYLQQSQRGFDAVAFGIATDKPIPNAYAP